MRLVAGRNIPLLYVEISVCNTSAVSDNQRLTDMSYARRSLASGHARWVREQLKLSRNAIARELDVDPGSIYAWERGTRTPLDRYAAEYGALLRRLEEQLADPPTRRKTSE